MAPLAWVIHGLSSMALHPVLQVNKIMAISQSGGGGSLSMGHSEGNAFSMYGSSSSVTGK